MNHTHDVIYFETNIAYTHGHNTFFDILPELGIVGVSLAAFVHFSVLLGTWKWIPRSGDATQPADAWLRVRIGVLGLIGLSLFGVTEPMASIPLGWFVLVTLVAVTLAPRSTPKGPARHRPN